MCQVVSEVALIAHVRTMAQVFGATRKGRAMVQAVCRRLLTAESMVRRRTSPSGIYGGHSGTGTGFFSEYFHFPLSVSF